MKISGILLAAGYGTRLRPITNISPKPVIPFLGIPMIYYAINHLEKLECEDIVINTHYLADQVFDVCKKYKASAKIKYSHENIILGTGGALQNAEKLFANDVIFTALSDMIFERTEESCFFKDKLKNFDSGIFLIDHPGNSDYSSVLHEGELVTTIDRKDRGKGKLYSGSFIKKALLKNPNAKDISFDYIDGYINKTIEEKKCAAIIFQNKKWFNPDNPEMLIHAHIEAAKFLPNIWPEKIKNDFIEIKEKVFVHKTVLEKNRNISNFNFVGPVVIGENSKVNDDLLEKNIGPNLFTYFSEISSKNKLADVWCYRKIEVSLNNNTVETKIV